MLDVSPITPTLFLSGIDPTYDPEVVRRFGCIISLVSAPRFIAHIHHPKHYVFYVDDGDVNISQYFKPIIELLRTQPTPILVHCMAGISRSATVVAAYLLYTFRTLNVRDVLEFMRSRRPIIRPNPSFRGQLERFERRLKNDS
jgi:dual specificity phosphatase 12